MRTRVVMTWYKSLEVVESNGKYDEQGTLPEESRRNWDMKEEQDSTGREGGPGLSRWQEPCKQGNGRYSRNIKDLPWSFLWVFTGGTVVRNKAETETDTRRGKRKEFGFCCLGNWEALDWGNNDRIALKSKSGHTLKAHWTRKTREREMS